MYLHYMKWKIHFVLFSLSALVLFSCQPDENERIPDVSDIDVAVDLRRFEQELFKLDTNDLAVGLGRLEADFPAFGNLYFERILGSKNPMIAQEGHVAYIRGFLQHPSVRQLYDTAMIVYPDLEEVREEYRQAFRFFRHYFPEEPLPTVTTFISEYSIGAFVYDDNALGVGLDFFLGEDYPYLDYNPNNSNFSAYLTRSFNRDHLVSKSLQPLVQDLVGQPAGERMLDYMINNGKQLYILDRLLPFAPDSVIMEVTGAQMDWLYGNELEIWAYFLQEELLYSSTWQDIRKFVEYSPHSPGMPPDAPGRTANFIGWRIVRASVRFNK